MKYMVDHLHVAVQVLGKRMRLERGHVYETWCYQSAIYSFCLLTDQRFCKGIASVGNSICVGKCVHGIHFTSNVVEARGLECGACISICRVQNEFTSLVSW